MSNSRSTAAAKTLEDAVYGTAPEEGVVVGMYCGGHQLGLLYPGTMPRADRGLEDVKVNTREDGTVVVWATTELGAYFLDLVNVVDYSAGCVDSKWEAVA